MAAVLGTGVFLRLWQLTAVGFNSDEAVYAGQAASLAGNATYLPFFPIFRAHPLLFQTTLSLIYRFGVTDLTGRVLAVVVGVSAVVVSYFLGKELYGRRVGLVTAAIVACMPYEVVVSRQVLLDGPAALFATVSLFLLARYATTKRPLWLHAMAAALALAFLSKETTIVCVAPVYIFFALSPEIEVRLWSLVSAGWAFLAIGAAYPVALLLSGKKSTGQSFLAWQLFRRPNHSWSFYFTTVPAAIGILVILAAAAGLFMLRPRWSWREKLLVLWVAVPFLFFEVWSVKGFQYLLPVAVPIAVLAARALTQLPAFLAEGLAALSTRPLQRLWAVGVPIAVVLASLAVPSWQAVHPTASGTFLAGSGGVPGGRAAGRWIAGHLPQGAVLLTLGPSMGNILMFYGHRQTYGLSISPDPLHRNPVYEPVKNPDLQLRKGQIQYLVWDSYSAARSPFFSHRMLGYASRFHGRVVHIQALRVTTADAHMTLKPVIVIYEVRP